MPDLPQLNDTNKINSINYDSIDNNSTSDIDNGTKNTILINSCNLENEIINNESNNNKNCNINLKNDKFIKKKHLNSYNSTTSSNTSNSNVNSINDNNIINSNNNNNLNDNHISINSINDESDSSSIDTSDSEHSIQEYQSDSDESTNGYIVKNKIKDDNNLNEIKMIEKNLNDSLIEPIDDLTTNININSLNVTNSDVKIGNTNHINYVIKQYFPNKGANDNLSFESNNDDKESSRNDTEDVISSFSKTAELNPEPHKSNKKKLSILKSKAVLWTGGILASLLAFIGIVVVAIEVTKTDGSYPTGDGDDSRENKPINSTIGDTIISPGKVLRIISRDEWIAQPPNDELANLELPVSRVIIIHTATEGCLTQAVCTFRVRYIQTFHMESRSFDDIGYNFLVGGDGAVYVGRGWDKQGAHTKGYNVDSLGIAFIGTFNKIIPTDGQLNAAKLLIEEGIKLKKLKPNYKLYGHRNFIPSESPGEELFKIIQKWPHFTSTQNN